MASSADHPANYRAGAVVRYCGATDTKGSRWVATVIRGPGVENRYRVTVPYQDGPDSAVAAVVSRFNEVNGTAWIVDPCAASIDGGTTYVYRLDS